MKNFVLLLAIIIALSASSCNNSTDAAKDTPAADTGRGKDTATAAISPAPAAFTPFDIMEIGHAVKDYDKWRPAFDVDSTARKASGLSYIVMGRETGKPNNLLIFLTATDIPKSKAFAADPRLKDVMTKNGVVSKPAISYFHVIRFNDNSKEKQWVVVTHKVKDFDAWLKVYDGEGAAARAEQGLYDVVLARGVDDPNTVQLIFDIKDLEKAKASIASEEKKKLMASAGVEGVPAIHYYTSTE